MYKSFNVPKVQYVDLSREFEKCKQTVIIKFRIATLTIHRNSL